MHPSPRTPFINLMHAHSYNRDTKIVRNEFVFIGDSVVASWGYTAPLGGAAGDDELGKFKSGIDGRNGTPSALPFSSWASATTEESGVSTNMPSMR